MPVNAGTVDIYTDGSCHTQLRIGAWATLIFTSGDKIMLTGTVMDTTHNRMELTAVIKGLEYVSKNCNSLSMIRIFSDSQYVTGLAGRKEKLTSASLCTQKGTLIQNADLVEALWAFDSFYTLEFIKVKAHQKEGGIINYNIEVDKIARKMVRDIVRESSD